MRRSAATGLRAIIAIGGVNAPARMRATEPANTPRLFYEASQFTRVVSDTRERVRHERWRVREAVCMSIILWNSRILAFQSQS